MTGVAERLVAGREMRGISAATLAARAGMLPPQLSLYETGVSTPRLSALVRLAAALDVDLDWLAGRTAAPISRGAAATALVGRISALAEADRRLVDVLLDTLEARRRGSKSDAALWLQRRIETARSLKAT